ncbi:MAG: hypothetical protein MI922_09715 [Bacteroidales bacterium]|nr:hypothetical protein [Bacteroidales bacterium]
MKKDEKFKLKRASRIAGLLLFLLVLPIGNLSAHVRFFVKYKIVEKTVLVDMSNTKLKWKDKKCIISDSTCTLVVEVLNEKEFTDDFFVMADNERDSEMYGLIECEKKYMTFAKSPTKQKGVYVVRQFIFMSAESSFQMENGGF